MRTAFNNGLTLEIEHCSEETRKLFKKKLSKIRVLKGPPGQEQPIPLTQFIPHCKEMEYLGEPNDIRTMIIMVSSVP